MKDRIYKIFILEFCFIFVLLSFFSGISLSSALDTWGGKLDGSIYNLNKGNVGIGMTNPVAKLQVQDGAILFNGTTGSTPVSGAGTRFMWIPSKAALRAGQVTGAQWDDFDIGLYSTALGYDPTASGSSSFATGYSPYAIGDFSVAMGYNPIASGITSVAIGDNPTASGYSSVAIGNFVTASGDNSFVFGSGYGNILVNSIPNSLMIGFGTTPTLFVDNKSVGIGTTSPVAKLQVQDGAILFNGTTGSTPVSGAGTRFMWIPSKAALRAGEVTGAQWDDSNIGLYSTALGYVPTASGYSSVAMGYYPNAIGDFSVAMGNSPTASGYSSVAMGYYPTASGSSSVAIGDYPTASGSSSFAMGFSPTASGSSSFAMGDYPTASGDFSVAMGVWPYAGGYSSVAMGNSPTASGDFSVAMGNSPTASGNYSVAIGNFVTASGTKSFVFGSGTDYSNKIVNNIPNSLMIGFGTTPTLFVDNKSVGIGTTSPTHTLNIVGGANITSDSIIANNLFVSGSGVGIGTMTPTTTLDVNGLIRMVPILGSQQSGGVPKCDEKIEGAIYYDKEKKKHYGCNGIEWYALYNEREKTVSTSNYSASSKTMFVPPSETIPAVPPSKTKPIAPSVTPQKLTPPTNLINNVSSININNSNISRINNTKNYKIYLK